MVFETKARRNTHPGGPPTLIVYSRDPCHLCDVAKAALNELRGVLDFELELRDVDSEPVWADAYGDQVPVGFIGERKVFKYKVDAAGLRAALRAHRRDPTR